MKKSLLALAVLGAFAGAASAQSSVTLFGTIDSAIEQTKTTLGNGSSVKNKTMTRDRQGTTQLSVKGVEDLGGGMQAIFLAEFDHDGTSSDAATGHLLGSAGGEVYVGLAGGFGSIKLGAPNEPSLTTQGGRQPFGTKLGSGFGGALGTGHVRQSKSIVYATPNMGGLVASIMYTGEKPSPGVNSTTFDLGVNYDAGPLRLSLSHYNRKTDNNKQTNLFGSYDLGIARIILGMHTEKQSAINGSSVIDAKGVNLAFVAPLASNLNLLGNFAKLDDKTAANRDRKLFAIGPQYLLSKRTSVYARVVNEKTDNIPATSTTLAKKTNTVLLGVQHNF